MKTRLIFIIILLSVAFLLLGSSLKQSKHTSEEDESPPIQLPRGFLANRIPEHADILFVSIRHVLFTDGCMDEDYTVIESFLNVPECIEKIYDAETNALATPRQIFSLDIETGETIQLTNIEYDFSSIKPVDSTKIIAIGAGADTNNDTYINTNDEINIYLIDLAEQDIKCLTCELNLTSLNNPDYSTINGKIIFSAQYLDRFHNYLFTVDLDGALEQITFDEEYMDFDCSWSEDGSMVAFSRLPAQDYPFTIPSQVWLMDSDGGNPRKITDGGDNLDGEEPHGPYPIGIDADPDLSPDNTKIVFSRLKTGKQNEPFGVFELVVVDIESGEEIVLDSSYANMIPEWKEQGIVFIRQEGSTRSVMERLQSVYIYRDGKFTCLEPYPFNVFPIGSNGASWTK
jgi:Tol biopolymer transport system component